jgi:uncharacterized protein
MTDQPNLDEANLDEARRAIASPCINVCTLDVVRNQCTGCLRTRDEIAGWLSYTHEEREHIMQSLATRAPTTKSD